MDRPQDSSTRIDLAGRWLCGWLPWAAIGIAWLAAGELLGRTAVAEPAVPVLHRVGETPVAAAFSRVLPGGELEFAATNDETISLSPERVVRWGVARGTGSYPLAVMSDEGVITLSDYAHPMVEFGDDSATLATLRCGKMQLDRNRIRGLILAPPSDPSAGDRLLDEIRATTAAHDTVRLRNGDRLTGVVAQIVDHELQLEVEGRLLAIDLERIALVTFDSRLAVGNGPHGAAVAVGLADGSILPCRGWKMAGPQVRLELAGRSDSAADNPLDVPLSQIVYLQSRGAGCVYLSSLKPVAFRHVPYVTLEWPCRQNRSVIGTRLRTSDGGVYLRGLGVHSACRAVYRVPDSAIRFRASVALDGSTGQRGSVVFRVLLAAGGNWKEAFRSPVVRGGDAPLDVDVDLAGSTGVALAVDYADFGDELDRANWLDARFETDPQ